MQSLYNSVKNLIPYKTFLGYLMPGTNVNLITYF